MRWINFVQISFYWQRMAGRGEGQVKRTVDSNGCICSLCALGHSQWLHPFLLALFLGPSPLSSFWSLTVCKNEEGRPENIYHTSDVNVYQDRWRRRWVPKRKSALLTDVLPWSCTTLLCKCSVHGIITARKGMNITLLFGPPPSVYLRYMLTSQGKCSQAFPLSFCSL